MKYAFYKMVPAIILLGALVAMPAHAIPTVSLDLQDGDILFRESFDMQALVDIDNQVQDLMAFGFYVASTSGSHSYDRYTIGPVDMDTVLGENRAAAFAFPGYDTDEFLLATLTFIGTSMETGRLTAQGLFDNMLNGLFYAILPGFDIGAFVDINVGTPLPESGTLLLLGTGLVSMAGYRRKRTLR